MKKRCIFISISVLIIVLIVWTIWGNVTIGITRYTITSDSLPDSFNGYRIAVVSDVHNAEFGKNNSLLRELIKKEKPDMIAITGDLVDSNRTDLEIAVKLVQQLVEIAPCYYVTGNHEAWIKGQYQELEQRMSDEGVVILSDNVTQLIKDNEKIQIVGLADPDFTDGDSYTQEIVPETKLSNMDLSDDYCILLSHRPETFESYISEGIDLVLSGHTHGGQFRLPFIGGLIAPNQGLFPKFDAGEYSKDGTTMIVSRGIGNSIIPIRFNNRPEVLIVEMICE